jgi:cobalt transporter subunit CbtB
VKTVAVISDRFDRNGVSPIMIGNDTRLETRAAAAAERTAPAVLALLFGAFLVLGAGFAHSTTLHNAAHDARHAFAFPCH